MNRRSIIVATAVVAAAVFAVGAATYRPATNTEEGLVRTHSPIMGPANAPVTIVEFFDPACESCRAVYPHLKQILARHPKDVRVVVRYAAFHPGSDEAVKIIEAARLQDKFLPVKEALLEQQPAWADHGKPDIAMAWAAAASAGLDIQRARKDVLLPRFNELLRQESTDIETFGVKQTPTFFVNGTPIRPLTLRGLNSAVDEAVSAAGKTAGR
jgi:protein-disulfide isomerase